MWIRGLAAAAATLLAGSAHALTYTITDLGVLPGGGSSYGYAINNAGTVVGASASRDDTAFVAANATMKEVPNYPGSYTDTQANGINSAGQIVGTGRVGNATHAIMTDSRSGKLVEVIPTYAYRSFAYGINDSGWVTGAANTGTGDHAFRTDGWNVTYLDPLGGSTSTGRAINASGQVAGYSDTADGYAIHAVLWTGTSPTDLGSLGGDSYAYALNDIGEVAGLSLLDNGSMHAFVYQDGAMADIGTLGGGSSAAYGINAAGDVVGTSDNRAFLYSGGSMIDLNGLIQPGSGWTLTTAEDINDHGQITGYGTIGGKTHAFLMSAASDAPEPSSWAMMLMGFGMTGWAVRHARARSRQGGSIRAFG